MTNRAELHPAARLGSIAAALLAYAVIVAIPIFTLTYTLGLFHYHHTDRTPTTAAHTASDWPQPAKSARLWNAKSNLWGEPQPRVQIPVATPQPVAELRQDMPPDPFGLFDHNRQAAR